MGNEINRILKLLSDLQHGDCWIGENFKTILHGVDADKASLRASENTNSIWMLTAHLTYWRTTVVNRINGADEPATFPDFLLPDVADEAHWKQALLDFEAAYHLLRNAIRQLTEIHLDKPSARPSQTYYELIQGSMQHDVYHMGQMMLVRRMLGI